jgi:hypothetical protein
VTIEARAAELFALVARHRDARCSAILDDAQQRAARARAESAGAARARMRNAFAEERRRAAERIDAAQARLATRQRALAQQHAQALLALAWRELPRALEQRWDDRVTRALWLDHALAGARALLTERRWRVAHPPTLCDDEQALLARLLGNAGIEIEYRAEPGIRAGLRVSAGANVVDCTLDGLIADRADIGARLLHGLEAHAAKEIAR